ncbi:MAG: hypothetical protein D6718_07075 [Acidobacteria bacterium]|nr:MAG: hypothetical protein D6718_07075 [Acidobacteriota bacterium]
MTSSHDAPPSPRARAYFVASFEVARRLAEGRGDEAIAILERELERTAHSGDVPGRRFLMSQIALCHARTGRPEQARAVLERMEEELPGDPETSLALAEGYLLLLDNPERASHHTALALRWSEERGEDTPELLSRARSLMARARLAAGDLTGAFGAFSAAPLPDWRVAVALLEAGFDPARIRNVLAEALPELKAHERRMGAAAAAAADQVRRLILWIDAGCPDGPPVPS